MGDLLDLDDVVPAVNTWLVSNVPLSGVWQTRSKAGGNILLIDDDAQQLREQSLAVADPDIVKPENVSRLAARAKRVGINRLTPAQIFILVLLWLLLVGMPVIQQHCPPKLRSSSTARRERSASAWASRR